MFTFFGIGLSEIQAICVLHTCCMLFFILFCVNYIAIHLRHTMETVNHYQDISIRGVLAVSTRLHVYTYVFVDAANAVATVVKRLWAISC